MSFNKPLPPEVFGEDPNYIAIRLDVPTARAPLTGMALHKIDQGFPGTWTYIATHELIAMLNAPQPKPDVPAPVTPQADGETSPINDLAAALLRLAKAIEAGELRPKQ
ncbi:MAG: hypothetical protein JSS23_12405 [Proteobacteria bacterium]|nr:hypothetical protein [Pseudomonadota bacterium]